MGIIRGTRQNTSMIHLLQSYIVYYFIVAIGITMGYHRYFAHREFKTGKVEEAIMLYLGLLCGCQSPIAWCGVHRMHHANPDTPNDPHSPLYKKWHEILFSTWRVKNIPRKFVKDLYHNPRVVFFHEYRYIIFVFTYIIAFFIHPILIFYLIMVFIFSYLFYGMLNLVGHNDSGPVNRWWVNIFAPFEGNHDDHHTKTTNRKK